MRRLIGVLVSAGALAGLYGEEIAPRQAPAYTADSIIQLATGKPGPLAPNTLAAIQGKDLSFVTRSRADAGTPGGLLPIGLPGATVSVLVNQIPATLEHVSPTQVTFVVPPLGGGGDVEIVLVRNGVAGSRAKVPYAPVSPEPFEWEKGWILARHGDSGEWVTEQNPLVPGEEAVLYATGLGQTRPPIVYRMNPAEPSEVEDREAFGVVLSGAELEPALVYYVGVMVGFPGIYEIRIKVPEDRAGPAEVHLRMGLTTSRDGVWIRIRPKQEDNSPKPEG